MISFGFTINKSFLIYPTNPITVPKTQVEYNKVQQEGFDQGDLTIILPKGERMRGHMYDDVAGYGPYYQIRFHKDQHLPQYLTISSRVIILLHKDKNYRYAVIEFRD